MLIRHNGSRARFPAAVGFVLLMTACNVVPDRPGLTEANHGARVYTSPAACEYAVASVGPASPSGFVAGEEIRLLSWNIHKGSQPGWRADLKALAKDSHLILLQEAIFHDDMKNPLGDGMFWSFSPGFQDDEYNSGVMTISQVEPNLICSLQAEEPWLNTPKAANVTRFPIRHSGESLLLINMHSINFALGLDEFRRQFESVARLIASHDGPVLLSGDFNTWSEARRDYVVQTATKFGLEAVKFDPDHRTDWFGNVLDHIFVRGLDVKTADVPQVKSSDHNPLQVTLSLAKPAAPERVPRVTGR